MKILFVSLGCDKNLVDSEMMLGMLGEQGYTFTDDEAEADIIVVNTCCFIGDAKEESINTLIEMGELKKSGKVKVLIACGCLAQRYTKEIRELIPEVDAIVGTMAIEDIVKAVDETLSGIKNSYIRPLNVPPTTDKKRVLTTGGHFAYLKIAEGCNKRCTYCVIPKVRGNYRSVPIESLVREAQTLAEGGVKELILVAQETTVYGVDLYGKKKLPTLLRKLCRIGGIRWIRILYCYPEEITEDLISVMAKEKKICHYLDLPIQHASDRILKLMGRRTSRSDLEQIVKRLREAIPDITLRTTLISGFPGETEEDHEELLRFVEEMRFDHLGVFPYSREEGTPAAKFPSQVPARIKKKRRNQVMRLQQKVSAGRLREKIGTVAEVLVEGRLPEEDVYIGRTCMDAPDVDGYLFFTAPYELMSGTFVKVRVTDASEYDLKGEMI